MYSLDNRTNAPAGQQALGLIGCLAVVFVAAAIGAAASVHARDFYAALARPAWAPPGWVFGPVWSALYTLMAIAAWLVWRARHFASVRTPLLLFGAQLALNALWSWLFFAWKLGGAACAEVLLLWCLIVATVVAFRRVSRVAAGLLLPYLAWVGFAAALTFATWRLNPASLG